MTRAEYRSDLTARLTEACSRHGERTALADGDVALSYAGLLEEGRRGAAALGRAGIRPGEPVLVPVSNRARDVAAFLGVWLAGGVAVPVHRGAVAATVDDLWPRAGARFALNLEPALPCHHSLASAPGVSQPPEWDGEPDPLLENAAWVVFTSGSTGRAKGVVHGHATYAAKLDQISRTLEPARGEQVLLPLQLTFSFGQWVALLTVLHGGTVTLVSRFDPAALAARLTGDVDRVAMVPTMARMLRGLDGPPPRFRGTAMLGGEPLPAPLARWLVEVWPEARAWDIYGLTETATCDLFSPPEVVREASGTLGAPGEGVECRLAPEDGELLIRSPFRMRGYLGEPDLTRDAFHGEWLRTGDLARHDEGGRLVLVGRSKELVHRAGNKISPLEIERIFLEHPSVRGALATGVPDGEVGERLHLFLVPVDEGALEEAAVLAWGAERLERHRLPDAVHFGAALPTGATGKADRGALRDLVTGANRYNPQSRPSPTPPPMPEAAISRFPVPTLEDLPDDMRSRILEVQEKAGFVPNVFLALAHRPDEFRAFFAYHDALMEREGTLSKAEKEMIVVATSAANRCLYCVVVHGAILRVYAKDPFLADQIAVNHRRADVTPRQRAMLDFAVQVAEASHEIEEADLERLRTHGFDDEDIWDIGAIAALFAMSNRLADLLRVEPNPEFFALGRQLPYPS